MIYTNTLDDFANMTDYYMKQTSMLTVNVLDDTSKEASVRDDDVHGGVETWDPTRNKPISKVVLV